MSVKHIVLSTTVAAIAVLSAASAFAGPFTYDELGVGPAPLSATSTLTREQVRAELAKTQREASLPFGDAAYERALFGDFKSTLSRTQVRAEAIEARRLGLLDGNGEGASRTATPAEAESIRRAGLRALGVENLAAKR